MMEVIVLKESPPSRPKVLRSEREVLDDEPDGLHTFHVVADGPGAASCRVECFARRVIASKAGAIACDRRRRPVQTGLCPDADLADHISCKLFSIFTAR